MKNILDNFINRIKNFCQQFSISKLIFGYDQTTPEISTDSEAKFRFLVESISQQLWIADAQGHIEYVNQYTLNYLRCSTIENCGAKWLKMVHPEDRSKIRSAWNHAFRETNNYEVEFRLYDQASQTYRWHLGRAIPGYNQQNEIVNWFGTNTDIHNQVLAEISLETTKCPYESITAISPVGIFHTDILGNCDYVNDRWCEITGINRETALNMSWINTIHPEDQPRIEAEWYHHLQKHRPFRSKYRFKHSHSHVTWVVGQTVPEIGEDGKVIAYVGTITDISEDKQVEEALAQQLRLAEFHADIDTICIKDYAIYMLDTQGRVISWNSGAEYITGYTAPEIIGRDFSCFFVEEDIMNSLPSQQLTIAITEGRCECENVFLRKDNSRFWANCILTALYDETGNVRGFSKITRNITEGKLAEKSLLRLQKAIESTSDAISIADISGQVIYVNPAFMEIFNYTSEQLNEYGGLSANFQFQEVFAKVFASVQKGKSWRGEVTMKTFNNTTVQVNLRTDVIKDNTDEIVYSVNIYTDITQQKLIEEGLRLRNRAIAANSNGIMIIDVTIANKPIIYVNPAFEKMTGYLATDIIGQSFPFCNDIQINEPELAQLTAAIETGQDCTVVLRNLDPSGSLLWYELNVSPVYDRHNDITHYVGIQTDITERKQGEIALLISQQRLQYLLYSSPAVIYTIKAHDDYGATFMSENIKSIMGYEATEFLSTSVFWLNHIHPDDRQYVITGTEQAIKTQREYILEYRFLHKDGTYRWVYDQGKVVLDQAGNVIEIVGYWADITNRKQLEQELIVALEKEKELNELKSRFISMTSHEFRTPLSTIFSSAELLEHYGHQWTKEKQRTHLDRIQTAVGRMTEMLNDILIIGKAEVGKLEYKPIYMDLVIYCRQLLEDLKLNGNHQVVIDFNCQYGFLPCCMDDKLLSHILINLLSNAIKYSFSQENVNFTLTCQDQKVIFEIEDRGIGIPEADIPRLFESFHRASNVGNVMGTGLGLAIVKKCVDIYEGEILVNTQVDTGTKFTVILPLG